MTGVRGQTTQDFAIGTSVLLLTIIGAFVYIQTGGLSVYEQPTAGQGSDLPLTYEPI